MTIRQMQAAQWKRDTPEEVQDRIIRRAANEHAMTDRKAQFPVLTTENFEEATKFQAERAALWESALRAQITDDTRTVIVNA